MASVSPAALRACGFVAAGFFIAVSAGCAGNTSHRSKPDTQTAAVQSAAQFMAGASHHTSIRGVPIDWQREHDGHVCFRAKVPTDGPVSSVGSCIRRLRTDEITYRISRLQETRQLVIVGVQGPRVEKVYLRFPDERWSPPTHGSAFFGYIPRGKVLGVVKVLKDGTRRAFAVNQYSA
jgi:hypothetical protein